MITSKCCSNEFDLLKINVVKTVYTFISVEVTVLLHEKKKNSKTLWSMD